jgi:hypothetical protein
MVMGFNPIQDGDWQGLNIALEKLFFTNAEAKSTKVTTKKTGSVSARKTVTIKNDASSEIADGNNIDVKIQGVDDGQGIALYVDGGADDNVTIPDTGIVYKTQAKIAVPSSYFLDLRGIYKTTATQQYTADVAILHDVNGNTITLTSLDETNNVGTAGPIAGGRDQAGAFDASSWIHFFFIYNPITGDVSSLSSASPTAPTLPTGYTFFVRVGSVWFNSIRRILTSYQMGDRITFNTRWVKWNEHVADIAVVDEVDVSDFVPATAKLVHGVIGLSDGTSVRKMWVASNADTTVRVGALCDAQGTGDISYGVSGSKDFTLPMLTAQTLWWYTETTAAHYALGINGFTDDL